MICSIASLTKVFTSTAPARKCLDFLYCYSECQTTRTLIL